MHWKLSLNNLNIIYKNNTRKVLRYLGREYDEILQLQPGTTRYEELKKQGEENIQTREKIIGKLFTEQDSKEGVTKWNS